ncbi:hypothetical protein Lal_00030413 [Lupinus albus]|nr:hypothetical protein Lal_00030413 [Lupinus albus]
MRRFSKEEIELRKQMALGETVKSRDILDVGNLNLEDRLLHYFLSYVIIPKYSNHSQINDMELQLIDKPDAPADPTTNVSVNPHAQQPSDFHTESFSSAQMPSNHMIMGVIRKWLESLGNDIVAILVLHMDGLFLLRGYITNRMDAFDAQNQQVQIELQRLSYKINMMDLDEESSEPES